MATGLEGPAAGAALGQVKGIVDALLGPKLDRIRKWAKEKDLQKQLASDKLDRVFRPYLSRAIATAGGVHSIVFPQQTLPLQDIYEPLAVVTSDVGILVPIEEILNVRRAVIVDYAGMGKTTFSKYLFNRIVAESEKIPILCNLRNCSDSRRLIDHLRDHLDEFDNQFDAEVFVSLVANGKFFFILDGFDEIAPEHQSNLRAQIEDFTSKCRDSSVIITSRPQSNLPIIIDGAVYKFKELSLDQIKSLLRRYDKFSGLDVGERLVTRLSLVPSELIKTPLLLALLYRTFGINNTISEHITGFYSDAYEALYRGHDLTKAGFVRVKVSNLDIDRFRRALQAFSFYCLIHGRISWESEDELVETARAALPLVSEKTPPRAFAADLLAAIPLLVWEGRELKFIHRTFAEYFAAEFIARSPDSERLLTQIQTSDRWMTFAESFEFIAELSPSLARRVFSAPLARQLAQRELRGSLTLAAMCKEALDWMWCWEFPDEPHVLLPHARTIYYERGSVKIDGETTPFTIACCRKAAWVRVPYITIRSLTREGVVAKQEPILTTHVENLSSLMGRFHETVTLPINGELLDQLLENTYFCSIALPIAARVFAPRHPNKAEVFRFIDEELYKQVIADDDAERNFASEVASLLEIAVGSDDGGANKA